MEFRSADLAAAVHGRPQLGGTGCGQGLQAPGGRRLREGHPDRFSRSRRCAVGVDSYARQITLEQSLIDTEQRRLELATLRYRQGEDTYLNELAAQQDLFSAQQGLLQAQFNRLSSKVSLYQALGGGWK